ncbi:FAD-binding oxidoreductase [Gulosibacter macacae]|uniref:FAD-binding oxidoreductase n=1 Tax=Gulosibacter macacae TaxID=2488791 RepID=A0A3P3VV97_9MICO|nr:FAD-binding oxidoreductase [Gulosibacter macacae]RRJ86610.1 FAD-binding oxidoreductase [Gulosibacter macacae]
MMTTERPTPPGVTEEQLDLALQAFADAIGAEKVTTDPEVLAEFKDPYQVPGTATNLASAVVSPRSTEDVQVIVKLANKHRIPLWPIGRGKNNGYGGAAPQLRGTVMISFKAMNKVLEINEELGYAMLEPGVNWIDLHAAIKEGGHDLVASIVDVGWGGVVSNTLDHGLTYMPYSIDQASHCGFEVVLPNGDLIRTGSGAMDNNPTWPLYKRGLGPTSTEMFMQSNFGIVTKMGYWLMPKPEVYMPLWLKLWDDSQLPSVIDALRELMLARVIDMRPQLSNTLIMASMLTTRAEWYDGPGQMPDEIIQKIAEEMGLGRWMMRFALYGDETVVDHNYARLRARFLEIPTVEIIGAKYGADEWETLPNPHEQIMIGVPNLDLYKMAAWSGGDEGGHVDFSPVIPLTSRHAAEAQKLMEDMCAEAGIDYLGGLLPINARSTTFINVIPFDTKNPEQVDRAYAAAKKMVARAGKMGYGEYRAHLSFMDLAAEQFGFNDHAQRRFNEQIKDSLDPNGIIAPGKSGIWGSRFRAEGYPKQL